LPVRHRLHARSNLTAGSEKTTGWAQVLRSGDGDEDLGAETPAALHGTLLKGAEAYH
jgi:hypothetical protein